VLQSAEDLEEEREKGSDNVQFKLKILHATP